MYYSVCIIYIIYIIPWVALLLCHVWKYLLLIELQVCGYLAAMSEANLVMNFYRLLHNKPGADPEGGPRGLVPP